VKVETCFGRIDLRNLAGGALQFAKEVSCLALAPAVNEGYRQRIYGASERFGVRAPLRLRSRRVIARIVDLKWPRVPRQPGPREVRSMRLTLEAATSTGDATFDSTCLSTG